MPSAPKTASFVALPFGSIVIAKLAFLDASAAELAASPPFLVCAFIAISEKSKPIT